MTTRQCLAAGVGSLLLTGAAWAEDFDGSKRLICATVEAHECVMDGGCEAGTPGALGAPQFLRVDVAGKRIVGPERVTEIQLVERHESQLLLMGTELGLAWTMALERGSGAMSVTLANRDGAYVLFGSCTAP